jgi:hypothetical protein
VSKKRFTQADIENAYQRGLAAGRKLANAEKKLSGEAELERAWKRHGKVLLFIDMRLLGDTTRGARGRALDAAAKHFHKDRSAIEKVWSAWGMPPGPTSLDDPDWDLIEKHCTRKELKRFDDEKQTDFSNLPFRRLLKLAKTRAKGTTAS